MVRLYSKILLIFFLLIFSVKIVNAASSYVLPYPATMPGSIFYKLDILKERLGKVWYFGDFGQFKYNLHLSDKYLVEAKILFEYKQYLLGVSALQKSTEYFEKTFLSLDAAGRHGKNIQEKKLILREAAAKHTEELGKMRSTLPQFFNWQPEKSNPSSLKLWETIDRALSSRRSAL